MTKRLMLAAKLDSSAAVPLRDEIAPHQDKSLTLDASQVSHIGGLCTELLLCVGHIWRTSGHTLTIENATEAMCSNLLPMGLTIENLQTGQTGMELPA